VDIAGPKGARLTHHLNAHPQRFSPTETKEVDPLRQNAHNDQNQHEFNTHHEAARQRRRSVPVDVHAAIVPADKPGQPLRASSLTNRRTLRIHQRIALGATCSLLLLTFVSIVRYEQEKINAITINTATIFQPTQTDPTPPLAQHPTPSQASSLKTPVQKAKQPTPPAVPTQAISTPIPIRTVSTPAQARTTPQVTPTQAPEPLTKSAYIAIARSDAKKVGINPDYFVQQIQIESNFNPNAYAPSGATGIAQFMPETASGLGIDPTDPLASLNAAAHLMANLAHQFGNNYAKALAAYNLGSERVEDAERAGGANWLTQLPASTQNYIHEIMD
jgi:hypothetical protein